MSRRLSIEIIADLLIVVFAIIAAGKLSNYGTFLLLLHFQPYINHLPTNMAWILPAVELIIAIMLAMPRSRKTALYIAFIIMSVSAGYRIFLFLSNSHLPCTCGNLLRPLLTEHLHILFNVLLAALSLTGIILIRIETRRNTNITVRQALPI